MQPNGNVITRTLGLAFGGMVKTFWPVLVVLGVFLALVAIVWLYRRFTNVG